MSSPAAICRLCKTTKFLSNLYRMDGDTTMHQKTILCLDLHIQPDDGLPTMICKRCEKKIKKFYNFKQKCLQVDMELRTMQESLELKISDETNETVKLEDTFEDIFHQTDETNLEFGKHIDDQILDSEKYTQNEQEIAINSLQCEICGNIYSTKGEFKKHLATHGVNKLFQCELCPKRFTRADSSLIHMRSHLGIKPFICEICGRASTKRQDLIRHMKIHSDEKKYECPTCGRRFKRSSDLCSHVRTHTKARPYKCTLCEKDYTSHSGLRKHYNTHYKKSYQK